MQNATSRGRRPRPATKLSPILLFGAVGLVAHPTLAYEVRVRDVHVTQGTQTVKWEAGNPHGFAPQAGNTIPLVARRSTAVRVLLEVIDPDPVPPSLTGRLEIRVDGQPVYTGLAPINQPFAPPAAPDIQDENGTLNFEIPAPTWIVPQGPPRESHDVDFRVEIFETGASAPIAIGSAEDLSLIVLDEVDAVGVPVTWMRQSGAPPEPPSADFIGIGRGDAFLAAALPIDDRCFRPQTCTWQSGPLAGVTDDPYRVVPGVTHADVDGGGTLGSGQGESTPLLEKLEAWRNFCFSDSGAFCPGLSQDRLLFVYGWLPQSARFDHNGVALPGSNVGYGFDAPTQGQGTIAHEMGHMLGLVAGGPGAHNPCPASDPRWPNCPEFDLAPNVGWDVGGRIIANPSGPAPTGNGVTARVRGFGTHDLMNPGGGGALPERWPNAGTYRALLNELRVRQRPLAALPAQVGDGLARAARDPALLRTGFAARPDPLKATPRLEPRLRPSGERGGLLTLSGRVTAFQRRMAGKAEILEPRAASLAPSFLLPLDASRRESLPIRDHPHAQLLAEVEEQVDGLVRTLRIPIDARMIVCRATGETGEGAVVADPGPAHRDEVRLGPFSVAVPVAGTVRAVRLLDRAGVRTFARLDRSPRAPEIVIDAPPPGAVLGAKSRLRWRAADPDGKAAERMYHVTYSPDGGRSNFPVAVNLTETAITFDATQLPASAGQGVLRVWASDGLNTRSAGVKGLTNPEVRRERAAYPSREGQAARAIGK